MLDEFLPDGEGMTKVNDIVDRWNTENPNIHVTATKFDGAAQEMIKKVETDINAGAGPCLAQLGYSEVPELFVKGLTEDVTEYATQYESNYSGAFNMMKVGETIVGLPQDTGPLVYFYNKAAFEELGIEVPTTLEEFQTAAATVAAKGEMTTPENISAFYGGQDVFAELATANANLSADFAYMPFFSAVGPSMVEAAAAAGSGSGTVADVFTAAQDASIKALTDGNLPVAE